MNKALALNISGIAAIACLVANGLFSGCIPAEPEIANGDDSGADETEHDSGAAETGSIAAETGSPEAAETDGGAGTSLCAADAGSGAVGILGCACSQTGATACAGNGSRQSIVCAPGGSGPTWQGNGSCTESEVCDPREDSGSTATCVITLGCVSPGETFCNTSNSTFVQCDSNLIPIPTFCSFACANDAGCTGVCEPTSTRCNGNQPQSCDSSGQWANQGAPCPAGCQGSGVCSSPEASVPVEASAADAAAD
jgi:hypothetical protein